MLSHDTFKVFLCSLYRAIYASANVSKTTAYTSSLVYDKKNELKIFYTNPLFTADTSQNVARHSFLLEINAANIVSGQIFPSSEQLKLPMTNVSSYW